MDKIFNELFKNLTKKEKIGNKIADLTIDEITQKESIDLMGADLIKQIKKLSSEHEFRKINWWHQIEKKYDVLGVSLRYENGAIYERIEDEELE